MPPVRQSSRNRRAVEPYQAAPPPQLTQQQMRRQNARYRHAIVERDGVPQQREHIVKKIKRDDKHQSISEARALKSQLGSTLRALAKGKASKITAFCGDLRRYSHAYRKYNNGDFELQPHFDQFSSYRAPQYYANEIFWIDKELNEQTASIVITNQFKLDDLVFNSNEKILDIISIILGNGWRTRIHKAAAISHVMTSLSESKVAAIYAPYYCSACNQLLDGKEELLKHARSFHPNVINPNEHGELTADKLKKTILAVIGDSVLGQKLLTASSHKHDRLSRELLQNELVEVRVRQPEAPHRHCRLNLSRLRDFDDYVEDLLEEIRQENLGQQQN